MKLPNFYFERRLWEKGLKFIAGVDEVGRGSFAGPVVAGAVVFASQAESLKQKAKSEGIYINDSKKLTARRRETADEWIRENAITWGIGEVSVFEINRLGIAKATYSAFRRAIGNANVRLHKRVEYLLIDAFYIPYVRGLPKDRRKEVMGLKRKKIRKFSRTLTSSYSLHPHVGRVGLRGRQLAIVNGDGRSFSIAAASIIAKVYRDRVMSGLGKAPKYQEYGWVSNKGYGTKLHCKAIIKFGTTKYHRKQFVDTFLEKQAKR